MLSRLPPVLPSGLQMLAPNPSFTLQMNCVVLTFSVRVPHLESEDQFLRGERFREARVPRSSWDPRRTSALTPRVLAFFAGYRRLVSPVLLNSSSPIRSSFVSEERIISPVCTEGRVFETEGKGIRHGGNPFRTELLARTDLPLLFMQSRIVNRQS